jgi:hypothetical protein
MTVHDQVPPESGPDSGRGAEAGHRPQEVSQGREGPLPLQWSRGMTFSCTNNLTVYQSPTIAGASLQGLNVVGIKQLFINSLWKK